LACKPISAEVSVPADCIVVKHYFLFITNSGNDLYILFRVFITFVCVQAPIWDSFDVVTEESVLLTKLVQVMTCASLLASCSSGEIDQWALGSDVNYDAPCL